MLNRKLTEADIGKEFSLNYNGTPIAATLLYVEKSRLPYCFNMLNPPAGLGSYCWTDADGRSSALPESVFVSEVEEPEEFKIT